MATLINVPIDEGQFDDAPRPSQLYIDTCDPEEDVNALDWPDSPFEDEDDDLDDAYDENRVEDEDWEIAERGMPYRPSAILFLEMFKIMTDFTKQYNRLKQHVAVRTGNAQGASSALNQSSTFAVLPAVNHPRTTVPLSAPSNRSNGKDKTIDQLASLAKYSSRIARIDVPYIMGVGVNRKGPSAHANLKDKSDRATNEQVLDPRTRLILFKMIGRGLLHEVNGCVSTGKEVRLFSHCPREKCQCPIIRQTSTTPLPQTPPTSRLRSTKRLSSCSKIAPSTLLESIVSGGGIAVIPGKWYVFGPRRKCGTSSG